MREAKARIGRIADAINASLRQVEASRRVAALQAQFERDSRYQDLVAPNRYLIKEGVLKKRYSKGSRHFSSSKLYYFFLFNDILVYADYSKNVLNKGMTYKMKHILPLLDMNVTKQNYNNKNKDIEITSSNSGTKASADELSFLLSCSSPEERDVWYDAFSAALTKLKDQNTNLTVQSFDGSDPNSNAEKAQKSSKLKAMMGL
jgi:hypothetical protein